MGIAKDSLFIKVLLFSLCFLLLQPLLYLRVEFNGAGEGYGEQGESGSGALSRNMSGLSIENYIIRGAGYFLKGKKNVQSFLYYIEMQDFRDFDFEDLERKARRALSNITNAREIYTRLIQKAEATPYNPPVIAMLRDFNYEDFRERYRLNVSIFSQIKDFLQRGDITGNLKHFYSQLSEIEQLLIQINNKIDEHQMPELSSCWALNELCSEAALFGSYTARVFYALK